MPDGARYSRLDELRSGPVRISGPALVRALERLQSVRSLGIAIPKAAAIPPSRIATLARFADKAKVSAVLRLPPARRLATLVAFVHTLEASAQDDAIELFEMLMTEVFGEAQKEDRKARLRSLKDLDALAITLVEAFKPVVDPALTDAKVRSAVFAVTPRDALIQTLQSIGELVRPPDDMFYQELQKQHERVRRFLPTFLEHIRFSAVTAGADLLAALEHLRRQTSAAADSIEAPLDVIPANWRRHVGKAHTVSERRAYTFCVLDQVRGALRRRDVYVSPSWRYADPRSGLLDGAEWQATRPMICRTLDLPPTPAPMLAALSAQLHHTYRVVAARLPHNPDVRFERVGDRNELILTQLDKL
ncbi:MAG: Tn3 family transposase, partial [Steroidobacteraceae bacterium]